MVATMAVAATWFAAPLVLGAVGFGAAGPVGGSLAAMWQAGIGSVEAGSLFAILQSIGMVGMAAGLKLAISGPVAVAVGATVAFLAKKGIKVDEKCLQDCFDKCYEENTLPVVGVMESHVEKCKEKCIWECSDIKAHLLKTAAKSGSMEILSSPLLIGIVILTLILCSK